MNIAFIDISGTDDMRVKIRNIIDINSIKWLIFSYINIEYDNDYLKQGK